MSSVILQIFQKHAIQLDDQFDDGLFISYEAMGEDIPCYRIKVDPSIDIEKVKNSLPRDWKNLERLGKIVIDVRYPSQEEQDNKNKSLETLQQEFIDFLQQSNKD